MEQNRRRRRRRRRSILPIVLFVGLILGISVIAGLAFRYKPTNDRYNVKQYYGITKEDQVALVINKERLEEFALAVDGTVYVAYEQVTDYINNRFYWEAADETMLYTLPQEVARHSVGDGILIQEDTVYLSLDLIRQYTPMNCQVLDSPSRVVMDVDLEKTVMGTAKADASVRYRGGVKSPILTDVKKGDSLWVLEEGDNWSKVRTADGYIGYIQKKSLKDVSEASLNLQSKDEGYASLTKETPINLVWHQVTNRGQNENLSSMIANVQGVNVISPTWFYLEDNYGSVRCLASSDYVSTAHAAGMEVWALVDNFTKDVDTYQVLTNPQSRKQVVDTLVTFAVEYNLDGINVDFEELAEQEGSAFVQFLRELSLRCHANNLVLSVDNHVPYDFNSFYNRPEQAVFADYIILMSYDEHLNASTGEGSVASIDYVTTAIERMLVEVPAGKLINALPFYTRIWKEVPKTDAQIAAEGDQSSGEYVPYTLDWNTLGMKSAEETLQERGVELTWDEMTLQYYGEYSLDGATCKVWMEEERSIEEKLKVMQANGVAGVAAWKLGLEKDTIWEVISRYYDGN